MPQGGWGEGEDAAKSLGLTWLHRVWRARQLQLQALGCGRGRMGAHAGARHA